MPPHPVFCFRLSEAGKKNPELAIEKKHLP